MTTQRERKTKYKHLHPEDCRGLHALPSFRRAAVVEDTQQQALRKLKDGISAAAFPMHRRDYFIAADAISQHLGRDILAETNQGKFDALSTEEQISIIESGNLEHYGTFYLSSRPEVPVALTIVARNTFPNYEMPEQYRKALQDPDLVRTITSRFPSITSDKISRALT